MQVYDLRSVPRMTSSFAFNSGPSMLKFHPKLSSTLLVASARGVFTLADAGGAAYSHYEQVCIPSTQCGVGSEFLRHFFLFVNTVSPPLQIAFGRLDLAMALCRPGTWDNIQSASLQLRCRDCSMCCSLSPSDKVSRWKAFVAPCVLHAPNAAHKPLERRIVGRGTHPDASSTPCLT